MRRDLAPVREFKRRAEHALPGRVKKVVLYGSRARGDARRGSGWDVAIFIKGKVDPGEATALSHIGSDLFLIVAGAFTPSYCRQGEKRKTATSCVQSVETALRFDR